MDQPNAPSRTYSSRFQKWYHTTLKDTNKEEYLAKKREYSKAMREAYPEKSREASRRYYHKRMAEMGKTVRPRRGRPSLQELALQEEVRSIERASEHELVGGRV